jgi:hypothetical protein
MVALAGAAACHELVVSPERLIALEITTPSPRVAVGDTLRLVARPLNVAGEVISGITVSWVVLDTGTVGFQLDPSGLVRGVAAGSGRVQALAARSGDGAGSDSLRSDAITITVTK